MHGHFSIPHYDVYLGSLMRAQPVLDYKQYIYSTRKIPGSIKGIVTMLWSNITQVCRYIGKGETQRVVEEVIHQHCVIASKPQDENTQGYSSSS